MLNRKLVWGTLISLILSVGAGMVASASTEDPIQDTITIQQKNPDCKYPPCD